MCYQRQITSKLWTTYNKVIICSSQFGRNLALIAHLHKLTCTVILWYSIVLYDFYGCPYTELSPNIFPMPPLKVFFFLPILSCPLANFVIKDGLVAKICIIWNVLIKKKLRRGRQLPGTIQHVWDQPRTACTCMSSSEVPLYQSIPHFVDIKHPIWNYDI